MQGNRISFFPWLTFVPEVIPCLLGCLEGKYRLATHTLSLSNRSDSGWPTKGLLVMGAMVESKSCLWILVEASGDAWLSLHINKMEVTYRMVTRLASSAPKVSLHRIRIDVRRPSLGKSTDTSCFSGSEHLSYILAKYFNHFRWKCCVYITVSHFLLDFFFFFPKFQLKGMAGSSKECDCFAPQL